MKWEVAIDYNFVNWRSKNVIYLIEFPNGKHYVGCTTYYLLKRIAEHLNVAKSNRIDSKLYRAFRKYAGEKIKIKLLEKSETKEEMFEKEKYYIKLYDSKVNGYNSTDGGEGAVGIVLTEEQRKNISVRQKNRFKNESERKAISDGVRRYIQNNPKAVNRASRKKLKVIKSQKFRRFMSKKMKDLYANNPTLRKRNNESIRKAFADNPSLKEQISRSLGGRPILTYKDGKFVGRYPTLMDCGRSLKLSTGNIGSVLKGKRNHTHGYTFKREE